MFEKERGKDGDDLYRLLWGYNKEQLQSGAAPTLVDDLDNDNLDFRVLSFYNLQKLVGKTFDYRPEASAANRAQPVRRWRDQLKEGLIVPKGSAPSKASTTSAKASDLPKTPDTIKGLLPSDLHPVANRRRRFPTPPVSPAKLPPPPIPGATVRLADRRFKHGRARCTRAPRKRASLSNGTLGLACGFARLFCPRIAPGRCIAVRQG